jgi:hypothetical protein
VPHHEQKSHWIREAAAWTIALVGIGVLAAEMLFPGAVNPLPGAGPTATVTVTQPPVVVTQPATPHATAAIPPASPTMGPSTRPGSASRLRDIASRELAAGLVAYNPPSSAAVGEEFR